MQLKNRGTSFFLVWGLAIICLVSLGVLLLVSFSLYDKISDKTNFSLNAFIIPNYKNTNDEFQVVNINYEALDNKKDRDVFENMLVKQYIVNRYTVNGNSYLMEKNLGLNSLGNISTWQGEKLKKPSFKGISSEGKLIFTNAYRNFMSGKDGEKKEIEELLKENTTRSVRIVEEPRKEGDWTVTKVEFIYRTPSTNSLKDAKKEVYQISMICGLRGLRLNNFVRYDASSVFGFVVEQIKRERL